MKKLSVIAIACLAIDLALMLRLGDDTTLKGIQVFLRGIEVAVSLKGKPCAE